MENDESTAGQLLISSAFSGRKYFWRDAQQKHRLSVGLLEHDYGSPRGDMCSFGTLSLGHAAHDAFSFQIKERIRAPW